MSIKSGKTFSEFNFSTYPHFFASARAQKICGFFYNPVFTVSGSFPPVSADTFSFGKMSAFDLSTFSTLKVANLGDYSGKEKERMFCEVIIKMKFCRKKRKNGLTFESSNT